MEELVQPRRLHAVAARLLRFGGFYNSVQEDLSNFLTHLELHALGNVVAEVVPLFADLDPHDAVLVARQELGALKLRGAMFKSEKNN